MGVYEHFPYSNFHRANLEWIVRKLKAKEDRVEALEGRMDDAEADIDRLDNQINGSGGLADQVTNLGTQVTNLGEQVTNLDGRVTNLENGVESLLNAKMLDTFDSVSQEANEVDLHLHQTEYFNGQPDRIALTRVIPGASDTKAGVMTAALYNELKANTLAISKIGDAYAEALPAAITLVNNTNTRVFQHNFVEGYWVLAGAIVYEVTVPASVTGVTQVDLAGSISSDPNGPGWVGMRNPYFLPAGTYHIALPCSARAYKFNAPGQTAVTTYGCLWGYFKDVGNAGVTVRVLTNLTSETGNKTELEAVRII